MGHVADLGEQQRRALLIGKFPDIGEQLAQLGPLRHLLVQAAGWQFPKLGRRLAPRTQHRETPVAGNREQPGLQRDDSVGSPQEVAVSGRERELDGVLGLLSRGEHVATKGQQARRIALEEHLERRLVAAADLLDEPVVGDQREQPTRPDHRPRDRSSPD